MADAALPLETPQSLLEGAREYRRAVDLLLVNPGETPIEALGLIAAHCAELSLKGLLLAVGCGQDILRSREVRHNLNALWQLALDRELPIAEPVPFWCQALAIAHNDPYMYRYPRPGWGVIVPQPKELRDGLDDLISCVGNVILGSRSVV
jgi:hypothetical protein